MSAEGTWEVRPLEHLTSALFVGLTLSRRKSKAGMGKTFPIVSVGDVGADGSVAAVGMLSRQSLQLAPDDEQYQVRKGDILISARGTQLKVGQVGEGAQGAVASSTLIVVRAGVSMQSTVLFAALLSPQGQQQLQARARHSTSTLILNVKDVATVEIPVPPQLVQDQIRKLVSLGEAHYRAAVQLGQERRELAHAVAQEMLFGERVAVDPPAEGER